MTSWIAMGWLGLAWAEVPVVLPVPATPGPWMSGSASFCVPFSGKGRSLGDVKTLLNDGLVLECRRPEKKADEICMTVEDVSAWPEKWPTGLTCGLGSKFYALTVVEIYNPVRSFGETVWIKRPEGMTIANTWTLPEGPLSEDAHAVRRDGQPWNGVTCSAKGTWLSVTVTPDAIVDVGRCQFRDVSVPLRLEPYRL